MKSSIEVLGRTSSNIKDIASQVAICALKLMGQPEGLNVAIVFVSENEIKRLNKQNRNIDKVTDVLSFPATQTLAGEVVDVDSNLNRLLMLESGNIHLGDIAICMKRAREQAKGYGNSAEEEVKKLVIHSVLHLLGYDHIKDDDYEIMNKKEIELDKKIKI